MGHPAPEPADLSYALGLFGPDAQHWREASDVLAAAARAAEGLDLHKHDFGVAFMVFEAYADVRNLVVDLLHGGGTAATTIADNLITARDTYQREEDANVHKLKGIW
jgi:hypothetical protein